MQGQQVVTGREFVPPTALNESAAGTVDNVTQKFDDLLRTIAQSIPGNSQIFFEQARARLMEAYFWTNQGISATAKSAHS